MNKIFRSETFTKADGRKYYVDIMPAGDALLDNPEIVSFKSRAFGTKFEKKTALSNDIFGMAKPDTFELELDMMELSDELNGVLNQEFKVLTEKLRDDWSGWEALTSGVTDYDIIGEKVKAPNIWTIYSDNGDVALVEANYKVIFKGGVNYNPTIKYKVDLAQQSQTINIVLVSLGRVILEMITPNLMMGYFWLYSIMPEIDGGFPKTTVVYDHIYGRVGAPAPYTLVQDYDTSKNGYDNITPTITLVNGDKILGETQDQQLFIAEYKDGDYTPIEWTTTNHLTGHFPVHLKIEKGTYAGKYYKRSSWVGHHAIEYSKLEETTQPFFTAGWNAIINKALDGFDFAMMKISEINRAIEYYGNMAIERVLRETGKSVSLPSASFFSKIKFKEHSYENDLNLSTVDINDDDLYIIGGVRVSEQHVAGGFANRQYEEDESKIFEYENAWDLIDAFGKSTGTYFLIEDTNAGLELKQYSIFEKATTTNAITSKDMKGQGLAFESNARRIRQAVINLDVEEPNKKEYKAKDRGSYVNKDYSKKAVLHTQTIAYENKDGLDARKFKEGDDINYASFWFGSNKIDVRTIYALTDNPLKFSGKDFIRPHIDNDFNDGIDDYIYSSKYNLPPAWKVQKLIYASALDNQKRGGLALNTAKYILDLFTKHKYIKIDMTLSENYQDIKSGDTQDIDLSTLVLKATALSSFTKALILKSSANKHNGTIKISAIIRGT